MDDVANNTNIYLQSPMHRNWMGRNGLYKAAKTDSSIIQNSAIQNFVQQLDLESQGIIKTIVENPSFEYYEYSISTNLIIFLSSNPTNNSSVDSLRGPLSWTNPTESSPDYLIIPWAGSFLTPIVNAPNPYWGYQYPRSGEAYAHFGSYQDISPSCEFTRREYIQGKLSEPLIAGRNYVFGFYAVLAEISTHASKIGVDFTQDSVYYNTMDCLIGEGFYPDLETTTFYTDTLNWTKVEWTYTASGGERFFTVGNFWCDSTTSFLFVDTVGYTDCHASSYFIDDFFFADELLTFLRWTKRCLLEILRSYSQTDFYFIFVEIHRCI